MDYHREAEERLNAGYRDRQIDDTTYHICPHCSAIVYAWRKHQSFHDSLAKGDKLWLTTT